MMKINSTTFSVFFLFIILASCSNDKNNSPNAENNLQLNNKLKMFSWLEGDWEERTDSSLTAEYWKIESDSVIRGTGMYIVNNDTMFFERLSIETKDGEIYYVPIVNNQNDQMPVYFKLTAMQDSVFIFENPQHDFPQKVVYEFHKPDILNAFIEGTDEGAYSKQEFIYKKVKK